MAKLRASSIYESVISIAIISITITVATYVFAKIMNTQDKISYYQAIEKIDQMKTECFVNHKFINTSINLKEFTIQQTVTNYKENEQLKWVKYQIILDKQKIKTLNYLIQKK